MIPRADLPFFVPWDKIFKGMEDYEDSVTRKGVEENLKMMPLKALKGNISDVTNIHFHILLTKEDDVIVARCLDLSISSHGENEKEALLSLSDSIKDYLGYAIKECALDQVIDLEEDKYWKIYRRLELEKESLELKEQLKYVAIDNIKEVIYA